MVLWNQNKEGLQKDHLTTEMRGMIISDLVTRKLPLETEEENSGPWWGLNVPTGRNMIGAFSLFLTPRWGDLKNIIIDFSKRGRWQWAGLGGEREREKHGCERQTSIGCLPSPDGTNRQPRFVLWLGMEPAIFRRIGWCSNQLSP